jgi:hypothetical protein
MSAIPAASVARAATWSPRPGRRSRQAWAAAALAAALGNLCAAEPAAVNGPPAAAGSANSRVAVQAADGRLVAGRIVVEAADGSLLVDHDDGCYELFGPEAVVSREPADAALPVSAREFGERVLAGLPAGFELLVTRHYVVCFNTSRDYAAWCAALFERLHDGFTNYWTKAGLPLADPHRPLVVVIFATRQAYEAHAVADLGPAAGQVVGYYNLLSNRVVTFDLTGSDRLAPRGRRPGQAGMEILASPAASGMVATIVHEATHQLAFNGGLHQRLAAVPLWVSEGIATYFETPDLESPRGWRAIGSVNRPRLDHFLATYRPGLIEAILTDDELFRRPESALDAYAAAWVTTHHLLQTRKRQFVEYQRQLGAKRPLIEDSAETRLQEFRAAFGDPAEVERAAYQAAARLASRSR